MQSLAGLVFWLGHWIAISAQVYPDPEIIQQGKMHELIYLTSQNLNQAKFSNDFLFIYNGDSPTDYGSITDEFHLEKIENALKVLTSETLKAHAVKKKISDKKKAKVYVVNLANFEALDAQQFLNSLDLRGFGEFCRD